MHRITNWKSGMLVTVLFSVFALVACAPMQQVTNFRYQSALPHLKSTYVIQTSQDPAFVPQGDKDSGGVLIFGGDAYRYFQGCPEVAEFSCMFSRNFSFVLPKNMSAKINRWSLAGKSFAIVERDVSVSLFGRTFTHLYRIAVPVEETGRGRRNGDTLEIMYSPKTGVIAFGYRPPDDALRNPFTYWLMDDVGFGAQGPEAHPTSACERRVEQRRHTPACR